MAKIERPPVLLVTVAAEERPVARMARFIAERCPGEGYSLAVDAEHNLIHLEMPGRTRPQLLALEREILEREAAYRAEREEAVPEETAAAQAEWFQLEAPTGPDE